MQIAGAPCPPCAKAGGTRALDLPRRRWLARGHHSGATGHCVSCAPAVSTSRSRNGRHDIMKLGPQGITGSSLIALLATAPTAAQPLERPAQAMERTHFSLEVYPFNYLNHGWSALASVRPGPLS